MDLRKATSDLGRHPGRLFVQFFESVEVIVTGCDLLDVVIVRLGVFHMMAHARFAGAPVIQPERVPDLVAQDRHERVSAVARIEQNRCPIQMSAGVGVNPRQARADSVPCADEDLPSAWTVTPRGPPYS